MAGPSWPRVPARWRLRRWLAARRDVIVAPLCGAIALVSLTQPADRTRVGLLGFSALAAGACLTRRVAPQAALLPLMRHVYRFMGPALGLVLLSLFETGIAKMRVFRVPEFLGAALMLGLLGTLLLFVSRSL